MMRCLTVVDASGFNDDEWIVPDRRSHSEVLHIERYRATGFRES